MGKQFWVCHVMTAGPLIGAEEDGIKVTWHKVTNRVSHNLLMTCKDQTESGLDKKFQHNSRGLLIKTGRF